MPVHQHLTLKSLPPTDRPTEKLSRLGAPALSDAELLAVIIRSGTAKETALAVCQRLVLEPKFLLEASLEDLQQTSGIGQVRAAQIKAAIELGSRLTLKTVALPDKKVRQPQEAIAMIEGQMHQLTREEFWVILLDTRHRVIRMRQIAVGSLNATIVHPRDLFRDAVKSNAAALILAHNHPSGDCTPSQEDIDATVRFMEMGKLMGVRIVDHIVIAQGGSVSMRQLGLI